MKLETKANWAIGLSVAALILVAIMFVLWCCNVGGFSAVNLDTFVGVIVALLAIIVTIAIGWQIWAAMDLKSNITKLDTRIKEVENIRDQFKTQEENMKQLHYEAQHFSHIAIAETYKSRKLFIDAFRFYMSALKCGLKLTQPINLQPMINSMIECANSITGAQEVKERMRDDILINDESIRQSPLFRIVQDDYEKAYSLFKRKVRLNDDQK